MISTLVHTLQKQCKLYFIVLVQYIQYPHYSQETGMASGAQNRLPLHNAKAIHMRFHLVYRQLSIIWGQINRSSPPTNYDILRRIYAHL
jgi:hypothetical protein